MPNVRDTPKRRRAACPACGRDTAYTMAWVRPGDNSLWAELIRDRKIFAPHKALDGSQCPGKET